MNTENYIYSFYEFVRNFQGFEPNYGASLPESPVELPVENPTVNPTVYFAGNTEAQYSPLGIGGTISFNDALTYGTTPIMDMLASKVEEAAGPKTTYYCLAAVKRGLEQAGITSGESLGVEAYQSVNYFRSNEGFTEITDLSPNLIRELPRGTIVVYRNSTNTGPGHIQVMLGGDSAASDFLHKSLVFESTGDLWAFLPVL